MGIPSFQDIKSGNWLSSPSRAQLILLMPTIPLTADTTPLQSRSMTNALPHTFVGEVVGIAVPGFVLVVSLMGIIFLVTRMYCRRRKTCSANKPGVISGKLHLVKLRLPTRRGAASHADLSVSPYVEAMLDSQRSPWRNRYTAADRNDHFQAMSLASDRDPVYPSPAYSRSSNAQMQAHRLSEPLTPCCSAVFPSRSVSSADFPIAHGLVETPLPPVVELGSSPASPLSRATSYTSLRTPISATRTDETAYLSDATVSTLPPSYRTRRPNIPVGRLFDDPSPPPPPLPDYLPPGPDGTFPRIVFPYASGSTGLASTRPSDEQGWVVSNPDANALAMPRTPRRSIDGGVSLAGGRLDLATSILHDVEHNTLPPPAYDGPRL
ncbi:hypothetical protein NUW54_g2376 [Trametes sanguinea]|uniref:Uncharacterized protein n=1 Tax=Trametes sanguinea TaxID=158606 RepID=A0ACC1Q6V7_9APHY|nr:hypothetical protein NUW54_g2376 [Trametes sanguinea]